MAEEQIAGFLTVDGEYVGSTVDFTFVDNTANHTAVGTQNGNTAVNIALDRIKHVSDVVGMVDENTETMNYSSNNQIADNDTLKSVVEKLDTKIGANTELNSANYVTKTDNVEKQINSLDSTLKSTNDNIGNRAYTYNEVLTDGESVTSSLNAIDGFIHNEFYAEEMFYPAYQNFTKVALQFDYVISQDSDTASGSEYTITNGAKILNDIDEISITDSDYKPIYKQGFNLKLKRDIVKVIAFNPSTRTITLNYEPSQDFRVNFMYSYNRKTVPNGKILNANNIQNSVDNSPTNIAEGVSYNNATSGLTATNVQSAIDEIVASSSSVKNTSAVLDFGDEENYVTVDIADISIVGTEKILVCYEGAEEVGLQGLTCGVVSKTAGVGYTIFGGAPFGASGQFTVNIIII